MNSTNKATKFKAFPGGFSYSKNHSLIWSVSLGAQTQSSRSEVWLATRPSLSALRHEISSLARKVEALSSMNRQEVCEGLALNCERCAGISKYQWWCVFYCLFLGWRTLEAVISWLVSAWNENNDFDKLFYSAYNLTRRYTKEISLHIKPTSSEPSGGSTLRKSPIKSRFFSSSPCSLSLSSLEVVSCFESTASFFPKNEKQPFLWLPSQNWSGSLLCKATPRQRWR